MRTRLAAFTQAIVPVLNGVSAEMIFSHRPTRTHTDEIFFPPATLPEGKLCALRAVPPMAVVKWLELLSG